jgi:hypothetical protein
VCDSPRRESAHEEAGRKSFVLHGRLLAALRHPRVTARSDGAVTLA